MKSTCFLVRYFILKYVKDLWHISRNIQQTFLCSTIGHDPQAFKKFVEVRFRTIRNCLKPSLFNFDSLVHYYSSLKKPTDRQKQLQTWFVEKQDMSRLKMLFVYAASEDMTDAIDFFEKRDTSVHLASDKLEKILRTQMSLMIFCQWIWLVKIRT